MAKVKIILRNVYCHIQGDRKTIVKADNALALKNPNSYFIRKSMPRGWDGKQHYITENGRFIIGQLDRICKYLLEETDVEIEIEDERVELGTPVIPTKVKGKIPRPIQIAAVKSILDSNIGGVPHRVGIINAATNAGKTLMMAMFFLSFKRKRKTIMLINDADLYDQFKEEVPELLGKGVGFIRGKEFIDGDFVVAMVPTLSRSIKKFKNYLSQFEICLVDEADLGGSRSYKSVLTPLSNCQVRVGLSGSIYMKTSTQKDRFKNMNLMNFFGEEKHVITKEQMVKLGYSTKPIIKIIRGNVGAAPTGGDYRSVYNELITHNEDRHKIILNRVLYNMERGRMPAMVVCRYHEHIEQLYDMFSEYGFNSLAMVHGGTKNRKQILRDFRDGKIELLITSLIVKRGKNFPLLRYILNASAGDSQETISQLMGRGERKHESKSKFYMDDLYDKGRYLERHSKHRINYYKKEKFKVIIKI